VRAHVSPKTGSPVDLPEGLLESVSKLRLAQCAADTEPKEPCIPRDIAGKAWAFHQSKPDILRYNIFYQFTDQSKAQSVLAERVPEWARRYVMLRSRVDSESRQTVFLYSLVRNCHDLQLLNDPSTFVKTLRRMISTRSSCSCGLSR